MSESISESTWKKLAIYRAYHLTLQHWFGYQELMVEVIRALLGATTILDAGCGSGLLAERLATRGHNVQGVDKCQEMIDLAQERTRRHPDRLHFTCQDATKLTYPDSSFEGVVSSNTIFAVADPKAYLLEIHRVLRPGGRLVITGPTPSAAQVLELLVVDMRQDLERLDLLEALEWELAVVIAANRAMSQQGFGNTYSAEGMVAMLSRLGFHVHEGAHSRLYRGGLYIVTCEK